MELKVNYIAVMGGIDCLCLLSNKNEVHIMEKGRFTLPGETGMEKEIARLAELWGVDAVRDSDGTQLSQEILDMGLKVYSTLCLIRQDNDWIKAHPQYRQQIYLQSSPVIATGEDVSFDLMESFFSEQFSPNADVDIKRYWQVYDRTTGHPIDPKKWSYLDNRVYLSEAEKYHQYTVSFLAYQLWEPVSMYNHITNGWTEEHRMPLDVRYPQAQEHMLQVLETWLDDHQKTDVVRFTTFFYNFDLIYNQFGKEKQVNWFGCLSCVSALALKQFEQIYGYALTPEDFVDEGRYNTLFKNPTKKYLDWMEFNQKFIAECASKCVDMVHRYHKKAIMFLGDQWAGTEPYGKYFPSIGLDAVVGAAGDGVTTRMIADIPVKETEARFYPYFFPDIFCPGGDPVKESTPIWIQCRRAIMRKPIGRMGYGGYLSLACKFPDFIDHVTQITRQFKEIHSSAKETKPYVAPFKIAILNSWGKLRSWQTHQVAHSLWNQRCYSYLGVMEALAGLPFDIEFISFDDIRKDGIPADIGVMINAGDAGTAWSGGENWTDPQIVTMIREWVYGGGGFIGIGEPTASVFQGGFFQLSDVLGVQKELGFTASVNKPKQELCEGHFITADAPKVMNWGEGTTMIYPSAETTKILSIQNRSCCLTANQCGNGRSVYMAGLPYSNENARLLSRAVFWSASRESLMNCWLSENLQTECNVFPEAGNYCVINNTTKTQTTKVTLPDGTVKSFVLSPMEVCWESICSLFK